MLSTSKSGKPVYNCTLPKYSSVEGWTTVSLNKYSVKFNSLCCCTSLDFEHKIWVHCLSSSIHRCLLTVEWCFTLIFNFTVGLLSICCSILFEAFTQPLLLGKRYFFSPGSSIFRILSLFYRILKQLRSTFPSFGSSSSPNFSCLGVFHLHLLFRMPKTQSRQPIHVKTIPVFSRFSWHKMLVAISFSKIESVKSSLLIAEIHLLRSEVNSSLVDNSTCTRKKLTFSVVCRIFPILLPHPTMRQKNHDDKN